MHTILDPRGTSTMIVDQFIGEAYTTVRHVSENIDFIKHISQNLPAIYSVSESLEDIESLLINIDKVDTLFNSIDNLLILDENIDELVAVASKLAIISNLHVNLPQLISNFDNINLRLDQFGSLEDTIAQTEAIRVATNTQGQAKVDDAEAIRVATNTLRIQTNDIYLQAVIDVNTAGAVQVAAAAVQAGLATGQANLAIAATSNPIVGYLTEAAVLADLTPVAGRIAFAQDTQKYYVKIGGTGTGSWNIGTTMSAASKVDDSKVFLTGNNKVTDAKFAKFTPGLITITGTPGYAVPQIGMPNYYPAKAGTAGVSFPTITVVDDQFNPNARTKRALKLHMLRGSAGTTSTDFQLRHRVTIPDLYLGRNDTEMRLVYWYKRTTGIVQVDATAETLLANGNNGTNPVVTKLSTDTYGAWTMAVFTATITDVNAKYVSFAPRLRTVLNGGGTGGGTSDIDEDVFLGPIFIDFNRTDKVSFDYNRLEEIDDRVAVSYADRVLRPWKDGDNKAVNSLFLKDTIGQTTAPNGFTASTGGANTQGGAYSIATINTPFSGANRAFKVDHFNNGTVRTDRQLIQIVDIPPELWGDVTATMRIVVYTRRSTLLINSTALHSLRDAANADLSGFLTPIDLVPNKGGINEWVALAYEVPITNANARKIQVNLRTQVDAASGVIAGETSYQTGIYFGFNKVGAIGYDINFAEEVLRISGGNLGTLPTQVANLETAVTTLQGEVSPLTSANRIRTTDVWVDANGNASLIIPSQRLVLFGDSQTDALAPNITSYYGANRTVLNCGIGGETSIQIANRGRGFLVNLTGLSFAASGTKRLKAKRVVPPRLIDEAYRGANWVKYGSTVAEPKKVEFFNASGKIGTSYDQLKAVSTVAGDTLSSNGHPFVNGDEVYFLDNSLPANAYKNKVYFVRDVTANTYKLAEFSAGAAIVFNTFAGTVTALGQFYLDWAFTTGMDTNISTVTHTDRDADIIHICVGTNNNQQPDQIIADIKFLVAMAKTLAKRFIVSTYSPNEGWTTGTADYLSMMKVRNFIMKEYPLNYIDLYALLRAAGDGSANDNADIAAGIVPRSLRTDVVHLTTAGYTIWRNAIVAFILAKGW